MPAKLPIVRVVAALIERKGSYLITQRRKTAVLPLLWDFPGGRVEEGESDETALKREVKERLGADIGVGQCLSYVHHPYESYVVDLYLYQCELRGEKLECLAVNDYAWVNSKQMESYPFTPVDEASMTKMLAEREKK